MFGLDNLTCVLIVAALLGIGFILLFAGAKKKNGPS